MYRKLFWISVLALSAMNVAAIGMRHDVDPAEYLAEPGRFVAVGQLDGRVETVLIGDRWVLTAAHAVEVIGPFDDSHVLFGDECYGVRRVIVHPDWEGGWPHAHEMHDLALIELERSVEGITPYPLYQGDDELGTIVTIVGRGRAGTGTEGPAKEKDHVLRRGTNRIDAVTHTTLFMNFDEGPDATPLEAVGGAGDSGGPALLEVEGQPYVAGIGSATTGVPDISLGLYGTFELYTRVSRFAGWIHNVIAGTERPTEWTERMGCRRGDWPEHSAAGLAERFFDAWDARSIEAFEQFYEDLDADQRRARAERAFRALVERYGEVEVEACGTFGDREIRVLAHTADRSEWFSIGLRHAEGDPQELERLYMKPEKVPGDPSRCEEARTGKRRSGLPARSSVASPPPQAMRPDECSERSKWFAGGRVS